MQRAVLPVAALALLLGADRLLALELGEITLSSGLNQPLAASIELQDVAGLDASQIQIALGTEEDFEQAGLERRALLADIRFSVTLSGDTGTIELATTTVIAEPFLDFVVSAGWPNGRQLREYTVLLDLPTFSNAPALQPEPATTPASGVAPAAANTTGTHAVAPGETLWEIAQTTRPDSGISTQQMMLAIQRANPDAFIDNNINRMRSGRVLRIPALQEISVIEQEAAVAQINQQNAVLGGQTLAVNSTGANGQGAAPQDELTVLSGDQDGAATEGSSDLAATIAALENELMLSEENLDRARLENLELTNRLASLEEEIELLRNIIAIEDERIAQLQAELTRQSAAAGQTLANVQNAAQTPAPSAPGLLQNTAVILAGLLAMVLAVLGVLVLKRRRAEAEAAVNAYNPAMVAEPGRQDADEEATAAGFLAGLLARFRRPQEQDEPADNEYFEDFTEAMDDDVAPAPAAAATPIATGRDSGTMLNEMGIAEDMDSLDRMLDDIDLRDTPENADGVTDAAEDVVNDAEEREAVDLDEVGDMANITEVAGDPASVAEPEVPAEVAEAPEAFEFRLQDPAPTAAEPVADSEPEEVEAFEFTRVAAEPAAAEQELENLVFDDTMLAHDDAESTSTTPARKGPDEFDTKLDLATAFEAMGDVDDALEILEEVIAEGNPAQVETAKRLQQSWRSA